MTSYVFDPMELLIARYHYIDGYSNEEIYLKLQASNSQTILFNINDALNSLAFIHKTTEQVDINTNAIRHDHKPAKIAYLYIYDKLTPEQICTKLFLNEDRTTSLSIINQVIISMNKFNA